MSIEMDMLTGLGQTLDDLSAKVGAFTGVIGSIRELIFTHFGQPGVVAAYIVVAALTLVILSRLVRIAFATIKYVVIPGIALAFIASFFLPYSFSSLLPVTVTVGSLILLFKG
jgi:threonine/homoserine efflux transporter RhtA